MAKQHVRNRKIFRDNQGFSLAETMVAAGMAGAISLAVVGIMKSAAFFEKSTQSKEVLVAKLARLGYELQLHLQQAIDIQSTPLSINIYQASAGVNSGRIRRVYDSVIAGVVPNGTQQVDTVALFISEVGSSYRALPGPPITSKFRGVGIFYQINEPLVSGAVYISTRPEAPGGQVIDPEANSSIFDGLVSFSIDNMRIVDSGNAAVGKPTNVQFHVIGRYFTGPNRATFARWCHPDHMGGANCPNQINYVDIERVYNVVLRNNNLGVRENGIAGTRGGTADVATLYGRLHFFNSIVHRGGDLY